MKNQLQLILLLLFVLLTTDVTFSQIDQEYLSGLEYRHIGPTRGGRVSAVVGIPQEPFTFFMASTGGGIWQTTDAGTSWENISDPDIPCGSMGAIAVAPSDPQVLYVGTGSPDPRGNVSAGIGVYRSTDGGDSWTFIGLKNAGQIGKIVVHPKNPDHVWVGVLGNIFGKNEERGVFMSKDGGKNWDKVLYVSDQTGCIDLVINPENPRILYAGMWTAERKPWTFIDGSEEGGIYRSKDGGLNWSKMKGGLPQGTVGRVGLAVSPADPDRLWVLIEAKEETKGGLYRSDDGGTSFKRINREHKLRQRAWYYTRLTADPQDENTLYVNNVGFHKSIDGGKSFTRIGTPHSDNHGLWINPHNTDIMIQCNDGGANVSLNGGDTWSTQFNQPTSEIYRVTVDHQFPYRVYGSQQDNSTISVPSINTDAMNHLETWKQLGGGESGHIAVDPRNNNIVYAGNYIGTITRKDLEMGYQQSINAYPQMHDGQAFRDIRYRFQWNAPIRISPHNPDIVYHCSQYVHMTRDGGKSWEIISPDLTTDKDEYHDIPGEPIQHDHTGVELYTTIFAFEESPINPGELWVGTDDGRLHIRKGEGMEWIEITPDILPNEGTINMIELSNHDPGRAFIAVYKYRENDFSPYIFRTNDYGENWDLLTDGNNGIPSDHFVRVVREDPVMKGLLFAGTEYGMYYSMDDGENWTSLQLNLPYTPITDMIIKENDLVLSTQGRSFWILDDITPLRTIEDSKSVILFSPADAIRFQGGRGFDQVSRYPYGSKIYFYLDDVNVKQDSVTLTIKDFNGEVRKVYSSDPDSSKDEEKLKLKKGLNRLVWNLKYEGLNTQEGSFFSLANTGGVKAPTGKHTVTLKSGSFEISKDFTVVKDPRWLQSDADIMAQYELAMDIKSTFNNTHEMIGNIRSIRKQLQDKMTFIKGHTAYQVLKDSSNAVIALINNLEKELIQSKNESRQDPINYPSKIDDQIAYLYSVVNSGDERPNVGAYQRFEDLQMALQPLIKKYNTVKDNTKDLNTSLIHHGVQLISLKKD